MYPRALQRQQQAQSFPTHAHYPNLTTIDIKNTPYRTPTQMAFAAPPRGAQANAQQHVAGEFVEARQTFTTCHLIFTKSTFTTRNVVSNCHLVHRHHKLCGTSIAYCSFRTCATFTFQKRLRVKLYRVVRHWLAAIENANG
jgi:hypothetical protein